MCTVKNKYCVVEYDDVDMVFFFQAEDGIRDLTVTGVQTCALPISAGIDQRERSAAPFGLGAHTVARDARLVVHDGDAPPGDAVEQRRFPDVRPPDDEIGRASCRERV